MANYQRQTQWWRARRGTRPASRSAFAGITEDRENSGGWLRIANRGELAYLSRGGANLGEGFTVYTGSITCPAPNPITGAQGPCSGTENLRSVEAPAGAFRCDDAAFGTSGWRTPCYVRKSDVSFEPPPGNANHVADQGQGFHTDTGGVVYYGEKGRGPYVPRLLDPGAYLCDDANFGPDPAWGRVKECLLAPRVAVEQGAPITYYDDLARQLDAQQRAQAAAQAQRDMEAAQQLVFQASQNADQAAQDAQIAENAQAQAAAALSAAEQYRQIQEDAHRQAADYAAQIALLAAQNAADSDAAMAAANAAAQAEALRQTLAQAQADQAQQQAAYDMAFAAAQVEMRNQEQANARVVAAQNAAAQQAANAAAGGAASPFANLSTTELLMYGGIAAAAIYLLMGEKKAHG